ESIRATLPELPEARRERLTTEYRLSGYDAAALTASKATADFFERAVADINRTRGGAREGAKLVANWVMVDLATKLNAGDLAIESSPVAPERLAKLLIRVLDQTLSNKTARDVFDAMWAGEGEPDAIIERKGLRQISDAAAIEKLVDEVLAANARQVEDYRAGKQRAFNSLVGQAMKASGGRANPAQLSDILRRKLG
ncbi:MAG: Asp-tRNA(Asn)/Glu-tRNA(Gln) amidotransferase subunit GatB, partial [Burkholderiales bacterium]